jgi:hypothetical protein
VTCAQVIAAETEEEKLIRTEKVTKEIEIKVKQYIKTTLLV